MPGENEQLNEEHNENEDTSKIDVEKLVQEKLDEALKDIKGKLDKAYGARDEALKKVAEFETEKRAAELARLQEEGKHKEAFEMQLAEKEATLKALQQKNIELTRNIEVRNALSIQPFKNEKALEIAFSEIVGQLVQNEQGVWVHKTGSSIKDFIKTFAENEEYSFLFKVKGSSGSGSQASTKTGTSDEPKSLFKMKQADVLKLAEEGKLPRR